MTTGMSRATASFLALGLCAAAPTMAESIRPPCKIAPAPGTVIPENATVFVGSKTMVRLDNDTGLEPLTPNALQSFFEAGPLMEGQEISIRSRECGSSDAEFTTSTFRVGPRRERPRSLGTLLLGEPVAVGGGFISTPVRIEFDPSVQPWLPLTNLSIVDRADGLMLGRFRSGWGVLRHDDLAFNFGSLTTSCDTTVTIRADIADQPAVTLTERVAGPCCNSAPGVELAALAALLGRLRRRPNL